MNALCTTDYFGDIFPTGYFFELKRLFHLAWPTILIQFLQFAPQPTAVIFCGHLGKAELDAVALANSLINVTGISIAVGMCTACDTLFSQTYGSQNLHKMGIVLQRGTIIILLAALPCWAIHLNTESLLLLLGQDPEVSRLTGQYMLIFMPGLVLYFGFVPMVKYLLNLKVVYPTMGLCFIPLISNVLLHYVLVIVCNYGIVGSAIAQACCYSLYLPVAILYIYFSKIYKETWHGWSWECLDHWGQFYRLAAAGLVMICVEWWSFEVGTFLAGVLGTTELGAQSVLMQTEIICYMTGLGIGIAANIRVGHYLGGDNPLGAKSAYRTAITMICFVNLVIGIFLAILRRQIAMMYTNVPEVVELASSLLPIMGVYVVFDGITAVSTGILRGCGRQHVGAVIVFISYIVAALPTGISLMFLTPLRLSGLWWSLATAMFVNSCVYQAYMWRIDWTDEAKRAIRRVGAQKPQDESHNPKISSYTERSALLDNQFDHQRRDSFVDDNLTISCSAAIPARKTSFMYPSSRTEAQIMESSLKNDFQNVPLKQLIFRRVLVALIFFVIFIAGIVSRCLVDTADGVSFGNTTIPSNTVGPPVNITLQ